MQPIPRRANISRIYVQPKGERIKVFPDYCDHVTGIKLIGTPQIISTWKPIKQGQSLDELSFEAFERSKERQQLLKDLVEQDPETHPPNVEDHPHKQTWLITGPPEARFHEGGIYYCQGVQSAATKKPDLRYRSVNSPRTKILRLHACPYFRDDMIDYDITTPRHVHAVCQVGVFEHTADFRQDFPSLQALIESDKDTTQPGKAREIFDKYLAKQVHQECYRLTFSPRSFVMVRGIVLSPLHVITPTEE